jgi:hypothetical protein
MRYKREAEISAAKLQSLADSTMASQKETELEHEAGRLMVRRFISDHDREAEDCISLCSNARHVKCACEIPSSQSACIVRLLQERLFDAFAHPLS